MAEDRHGPEILAGHALMQICVGEYQVVMNFDGDVSVAVETELSTPSADWRRGLAPPDAGSRLIPFLGRSVAKASIEEGDLVIEFERGGSVKVRVADDGYESCQIHGPGFALIF